MKWFATVSPRLLLQILWVLLCNTSRDAVAAAPRSPTSSALKPPVTATTPTQPGNNTSSLSALDEVIMLPWQVSLLVRRFLPATPALAKQQAVAGGVPRRRPGYSPPPRTRRGNFLAACFQVLESAWQQVTV